MIASEVRRGARRDSCRLFVAENDVRLLGFVFAEIEGAGPGASDPPPAWIHELWVEPEYRRRGIGGRLLAEAEAFFDARDVSRLSVRVESANRDGLEFWGRRGFAERARILERKGGRSC